MNQTKTIPTTNDVVLILCGGRGSRTGLDYNKILHNFGSSTALEMCIDAFRAAGLQNFVVVCNKNDLATISELLDDPSIILCEGGDTRTKSSKNGLECLKNNFQNVGSVLIHDGARPFVSGGVILNALKSAKENGCGIPCTKCTDSVRQVDGEIVHLLDRDRLFCIQTPQCFDFARIYAAYQEIPLDADYCDDAEVFFGYGQKLFLTEGSPRNQKITTREQLYSLCGDLKIGNGFDVHALVEGRKLILGGVEVPHHLGLLGHSDADVLTHAIMDALLSGADLKDIGSQFPDTDPKFKDISSVVLLDKVLLLLKAQGATIKSISAVIMCQAPKLAPYLDQMRQTLTKHLEIPLSALSLSATTTESLGIIGNQQAIAASAVCLLTGND